MVTAVGARHGDIELQPFQLSIAGCPVLVCDWFAWGFMMQHPLSPRPWFLRREEMDKAFDWWASIFSSWASERSKYYDDDPSWKLSTHFQRPRLRPRHREKCFESIIGSLKLKFRRVGRSWIRRASNHMTARLSRLIEWLGRANYWGKLRQRNWLWSIAAGRPVISFRFLFSIIYLRTSSSMQMRIIGRFGSFFRSSKTMMAKIRNYKLPSALWLEQLNLETQLFSGRRRRFFAFGRSILEMEFYERKRLNSTPQNPTTSRLIVLLTRRNRLRFVSVFIHESFYEWRWTRERARNGSTDGEWKLRWFAWWKTNGW